jgi:hypothetical protein
LLVSEAASDYRWKVIDCSPGDSVYIHPAWFGTNGFRSFSKIYKSYDKSELMMNTVLSGSNIEVLNGTTHAIDVIIPPVASPSVFLRPNRLNGKLYLAQWHEQYILRPDHSIGALTNVYLENGPGGDFSYRTGEPEGMYVIADNILSIINYTSGSMVMTHDLQYNLQGLTSCTNGEQMVMYRSSQTNSDLLFFASGMFVTGKKK